MGAYKRPLLAGVLPRVALIALNFTQPFLIERAVKLSLEPVDDETTNIGYGLIGAYAFVYTGIAVRTRNHIKPFLPNILH